jgi:hypothetical protein
LSRIQDLIAKQRAAIEEVVEHTQEIEVDGEPVTIGIRKVLPPVWDDLIGKCPPRKGRDDDAQMGYNPKALSRAYPNVTVDGETVEAGEWAEFFDGLDPVYRNNIEITIWGVNINDTLRAMRELGKARAGRKSPSPAN